MIVDTDTKISMLKYLDDYVKAIKDTSTEREIRCFIGGFMACAVGAKILTEQERDNLLERYQRVKI